MKRSYRPHMKCEYCTEGGGTGHIGSDLIGCGYKLCARLKQKCRQRHPTATVYSVYSYIELPLVRSWRGVVTACCVNHLGLYRAFDAKMRDFNIILFKNKIIYLYDRHDLWNMPSREVCALQNLHSCSQALMFSEENKYTSPASFKGSIMSIL